MELDARLLIIGAGPFGLSLAAEADRTGVDYAMVGRPMAFWRSHMPAGMHLRSDSGWHLDPAGVHTIDRFLDLHNLTRAEAEPLSLELYLRYTEWFRQQKGIEPRECQVTRLDRDPRTGQFVATLDNGGSLTAASVAVALGAGYFSYVPEEVGAVLPPGRYTHTRDAVDFSGYSGSASSSSADGRARSSGLRSCRNRGRNASTSHTGTRRRRSRLRTGAGWTTS